MREAQVLNENNRRPFMEFPWGVRPRHALGYFPNMLMYSR